MLIFNHYFIQQIRLEYEVVQFPLRLTNQRYGFIFLKTLSLIFDTLVENSR